MAQETVDRLLGSILADARLRQRFFQPARDQLQHFDLLGHERQSLSSLDHEAVELLFRKLDERILRA